MDEDIKEIKRRAGVKEATYSLGKQENVDDLVKSEVQFLLKIAAHLRDLRRGLSGNVYKPRHVSAGMAKAMTAIAHRMEQLDRYRSAVEKDQT